MTESDDRERSLDGIRATYGAYGREGRSALWNSRNIGFRRLTEQRDAVLADLIRRSPSSSGEGSLLDVGCGSGGIAALVESENLPFKVTGIDLLPERVAAARERVPSATFLVGSADDMPFDDASFDIATATTLFSSLPSPRLEEAIAKEIDRVMRPGGCLIWYDIRYRNPWNRNVHGLSERRLRELFPGWRVEAQSLSVLPPIARRLGRATSIVYPLLHALPPLRSHLIAQLRKPI
jgi:ubiquinone/menaquinone biosynthesis C-methylase UbiE